MATRQQRLDDFDGDGEPPAGEPIELLCEDHCGTYVVPFPCHRVNDTWRSMKSGKGIETTVIGWRRISKVKGAAEIMSGSSNEPAGQLFMQALAVGTKPT
jgi:hypothetical protein